MIQAQIVDLHREIEIEELAAARANDPFLRVAGIARIGPNGVARILDQAVLCGNCEVTIGAYPPERQHPDNQITGRGRWVQLRSIYVNRGDEPFYRPLPAPPGRAHTQWHEFPDTPPDMARTIAALNERDGSPAHSTIVPYSRFKVKCHACGKINRVCVEGGI